MTYNGDGYSVTYSVKDSWNDYQNIEITLTNTGEESIFNWALKYNANGTIENIWNGTIFKNSGTNYVIKNSGYNYEIKSRASVTFGYNLKCKETVFPERIELCSKRAAVKDGNFEVTLKKTNDWVTGFSGTITIKNIGDIPIEAWELSFKTNFIINDLWNGQIVKSEKK